MKVLITGATGFIGRELAAQLVREGHHLVFLSRDADRAKKKLTLPGEYFSWNPEQDLVPEEALSHLDAVVHLAGESVGEGRWTSAKKERIYNSRILGTRNLMKSLVSLGDQCPKTFVSASAIGFYGDTGDADVTETHAAGEGFLPKVCQDWETEIFSHRDQFDRVVALRIGIVLGLGGGALSKLLPLFKLGGGGPVASGRQWMSWIHFDDVVGLLRFALETPGVDGPINATAPQPVTNKIFSKALGKALRRPAMVPAPGFALRIVLGEMADLVLQSQKVLPQAALDQGYRFKFDSVDSALNDIAEQDKKKVRSSSLNSGSLSLQN